MSRAWCHVIRAVSVVVLTLSAAAQAGEPAPVSSAAPPPSRADGACDAPVVTWAQRASQRSGLQISPVACPSGVVRLQIAGAGCDFEVRRDQGFRRTADGAFGVSPIIDLDWTKAPQPMQKALAGIVSALAADPSLPIREGQVRTHPEGQGQGAIMLGSRRNQLGVGAGVALLGAAALGLWWRRRKTRPVTPVTSVTPEPPPEPPAP